MIIIILICSLTILLAWLSPFPHWPSWCICLKEAFTRSLPLSAKSRQFKFLAINLVLAPFHGLVAVIDDLIFSGYKNVVIEPIFIIGEPRCGSTFLHRTMALSGNHLAIRHYQWRYPSVFLQKIISFFAIDKVFENLNYWPKSNEGSVAEKMHANNLADWEEDGIFFEEKLNHHFFMFLRFPYPNVLKNATDYKTLSARHRKKFLFEHKKAVQKIAHAQGLIHISYLSKEVVSHSMISDLINIYPNAKFICTVRESYKFLSSLIPLARISTATKNNGFDPKSLQYWEELILKKIQTDCLILREFSIRHSSNKNQLLIHSDRLFSNPAMSILSIYKWLDIPLAKDYFEQIYEISKSQKSRKKGYANNLLDYNRDDFELYDNFVRAVYKGVEVHSSY